MASSLQLTDPKISTDSRILVKVECNRVLEMFRIGDLGCKYMFVNREK